MTAKKLIERIPLWILAMTVVWVAGPQTVIIMTTIGKLAENGIMVPFYMLSVILGLQMAQILVIVLLVENKLLH